MIQALKERLVLFVKKFNFKSFFIHVAIIVLSGLLTAFLDNLEVVRASVSQHIRPEIVWPMFAILGSFLKAMVQAIKMVK